MYDDEARGSLVWRPSRRGLLAATGALVAGGVLLHRAAQGDHAGSEAYARPPQSGGVLRIGYADSPDSLDPQRTFSFIARQINTLIYDGLTRLDAAGEAAPALATRWWPENGGRDWLFELRQDVRFHHGRTFTAADVAATIDRIEDKARALSGKGSFGPVRRVVVEGSHRVRIVYEFPFAEAPLVASDERAVILPADRLETLAEHPIGTGPFQFDAYQPGSLIRFVRNPDYWVSAAPRLDGIEMRIVREPIAQQGALLSGQLDLLTMLSPEVYLSLLRHDGIRTYSGANGSHQAIVTQLDHPPFDRPQVREAFRYLLYRKSVLASALLGQGRIGNDIPIALGEPLYPRIPQHEQDLDKARALITASGVGPISLDLWTSSERPPAPKLALALAESAARIGIQLRVRDTPYTEYTARVARKQALYTAYQGSTPSLYQRIYRIYHSAATLNYSRMEPFAGSDARLQDMVAEPDAARRHRMASDLLARYSLTGERIIPYFQNFMAASTLRVRGFVPPEHATIDFRNIWLAR